MIKRISIAILLVIGTNSLYGQTWVNAYKKTVAHMNEQNIEDAYNSAQECLKSYLAEDGSISENYATILDVLGTICYERSLYSEGVEHAEKGIMVRLELSDAKKIPLATAYYNLGALYNSNQQYDKSREVFQKALDIYEVYLEAGHPDIATIHWKLGTVALNLQEHEEAYNEFTKGFENYNSNEITMDYLSASYDFGKTAMALGRNDEAIDQFISLNNFYESQDYTSSVENIYVLLHLGENFQAKKDYSSALSHYEKVLKLVEGRDMTSVKTQALKGKAFSLQALGRNDEASAIYAENVVDDPMAMNNAAAIAYSNGSHQKAEDLYIRALNVLLYDTAAFSNDFLEVANNLAGFYLSTDKVNEAEGVLTKAFGVAQDVEINNKTLYASLLIKQGLIKHKKQDFITSEQLLSQAEELLSGSGNKNSKAYISLLNNRAALYHDQGNYHEAQRILEEAIEITTVNESNRSDVVGLYLNLAALYQEQGQYSNASQILENAYRSISVESNNTSNRFLVNILQQQANLFIQLGDYQKSEAALNEVETLASTLYDESHLQRALIKIDFARLYQARGQYSEAEKLLLNAVQQLKQNSNEDNPDYLSALNTFGVLYQTMGNYPEALKRFTASKDGYAKVYGTYHPGYTTAIENIASTYQLMGNVSEVEPLLKEALDADKIIYGTNHPKYAVSLHNLATLYQKQNQFDAALPLFHEALNIYEGSYGKNHPSYASTLFNMAVINHEKGNFSDAEKLFLEVLNIRKIILGERHPEYSFTLYGLASLYHNNQNYEKAKPLYLEAVNQYLYQISDYFPSLSEKEKSAFYAKIKPVFSSFADFAVSYYNSTGDKEILKELYNLQLSTKAILLNAANKVRDRILSSGDEELISKYKKWTQLKEQVIKYMSMTSEQKEDRDYSLLDLETTINNLEKELSEQSALFASTFEKQQVKWSDIQNSLNEGEAAIEIMRIPKKYVTDSIFYLSLVLRKDGNGPAAVILPEGKKLENRYYNYFRNAIKFSEPDVISYDNYWNPIQEKLEGINTIYISSDGIYNKLSLYTLYNSVEDHYLLDGLNIRMVSNTRELIERQNNPDPIGTSNAVVFGSPDFNIGSSYTASVDTQELTRMMGFNDDEIPSLPGTRQEAINLENLLTSNQWTASVFLDQEATEENFKGMSNPHLLHVATHGFFLSDLENMKESMGLHLNNPEANPLFRSGLLLTGAAKGLVGQEQKNQEDGVLTAYEAMNLHLDDTEIVILSACETGLGEIKNGEGVYGLQRSFIVAGANSVMMSLWKVNDETTMMLMTHFYEQLLSGKDKYTAFKNAQLYIRDKYDDPYHWGAFIILGK